MKSPEPRAALAPRSDYPILEEVAYLNTASFGLPPLPVQRAARALDERLWRGGTVSFDDATEALVYDETREVLARLIGGASEGVAIVSSVTEAIGQLAWWLKPVRGENVVTTNIEFPSVTYPWMRVAQETGCEVRMVDARSAPSELCLDHIESLMDERTRVLAVSHVQYASGVRLDPAALSALAHRYGALLLLDTYQSAGVVPLAADMWEVDLLVGGGMKWLCGIAGAAFCYVRPGLIANFNPATVGWRSTADPPRFDATRIELAAGARRMEYATMAYGAGVALGAAAAYLLELGIARVLEHDLALTSQLMHGLDALGAQILSPREDDRRAGIVSARFEGCETVALATDLSTAGVIVSPRLDGIRFSLHAFNDGHDVNRALEGIARVIGAPAGASQAGRRA